jgi:DNA mismatch endonuclease (patch repair protein)
MDVLTRQQRSANMKKIHGKDTEIEVKLRKALWNKGYRYRKNYDKLSGKPDIVFLKYKIVVFCDGEFFHGYNWYQLKKKLQRSDNGPYWINKIGLNREHDKKVNQELEAEGWHVIRFWGNSILNDTEGCVHSIEEIIFEQKMTE